jgi:nucleoside-diphosphate-sugar epimerase
MSILIGIAREKGISAYIGDGMNRWPAIHRRDAARVFRMALESGVARPTYHAIAEEGITFKEIADAIGHGLGLPVEAREAEHFGWFAAFAGMDIPTSSTITRELVGWKPTYPGLLDDLENAGYF